MDFPTDAIPDGAIMAPHHLTWGVWLALLFCAVVWDDYRDQEPVGVAAGLLAALFAFLFIWPFYPVTGATLTLVGLTIASICLLVRELWSTYPLRWRVLVGIALLVAWDDALEHAFPIPTPLDWLWKIGLAPHLI